MVRRKQNGVPQELWDLITKTFQGIDKLRESQKATFKGIDGLKESQKETDRQLKKLGVSIDKANGNFNRKWGDFMEKLVKGDLVNLLNGWGIKVSSTHRRIEIRNSKNNKEAEFDLVTANGDIAVVFEVKTTLEVSDVHKFIKKLTTFKNRLAFRGRTYYGGVAYLDAENKAKELAMENGLFVIESPGGKAQVSTIVNPKDFRPTAF